MGALRFAFVTFPGLTHKTYPDCLYGNICMCLRMASSE